jgi:hypothetical protein
MSDTPRDRDDMFTERVANVLRTPEAFGDDFEKTLVDAIRADRPIRSRLVERGRTLSPVWWRTPRTVRLSPLAGLALAASLGAITTLATLRIAPPRSAAPAETVAQAKRDTVTIVRFVFVGPAKSVALVGDFNRWGGVATPLAAAGGTGAWTVSVPVPQGRHEYAFIVDGKRWVPDPFAPSTSDEFNTTSSVILVGT